MKKIKVLLLNALLASVLIFMTAPASHSATGTYIDCIHGCPDLTACTNCCNQVFSSVLSRCNANRDQCEALCPPGNMDCLDECMIARSGCLMQERRNFDCPHWGENGRNLGIGSGAGVSVFSTSKPLSSFRSECRECHEDDR
ncbi:hypothetical protein [Desulfobotulus mexicanus]|uniref:Uncharacterized protein n=1 Tax=Desulfobotulus mexicanus TaxID=2586642 RepID=A0A5Q4VA93_9BACT|nr:hypothetical protein [Desulfobotulus mexicanus]TYT74664.1 hypothetical protein FIM25_08695 [Desulfobotulus mexicanus]